MVMLGETMNSEQPMNRRVISKLLELYNNSDMRPYPVPWMLDITVAELNELIDQGYELDLFNNPDPLRTVIRDNDCESLIRIIDLYPNNLGVTIELVRTSIEIVKLLNERFTHISTTIDDLNDRDIKGIMNVIDKMIILGDKIELLITYDNALIRQYIKLLKIPVRLMLRTSSYDSRYNGYIDINELVLEADIDSLDEDERHILLDSAIHQGNYNMACYLLESIDISTVNLTVEGLMGLKCLFDLSMRYPGIVERSNQCNINRLVTELISLDHYLQYCTSPEFDEYVESFDANTLVLITNPNYMKRLRGRVPTCSDIIQSLKSGESDISGAILNQLIHVTPASDKISYEEGQYLISLIDSRYDRLIMMVLIAMHISKIIDLRDYREDHEYIKFIVDRLPIDKSRRVKNARNSTLELLRD